ncbi:MAG TPA: adenylyl-sulfate kinase [Acidobacteriota bacterium]|nr:adenylyl-sulfate kinase [Acidobacteriota bacterium]
MTDKKALFIGRWQPFHYGHYWLIKQKLDQNVPVLVAVRDVQPDEHNPFTTSQTVSMIQKVFHGQDVHVMPIPDIESVNYGHDVGYDVIEHQPPEDLKTISATQIRDFVKKNIDTWKELVPPIIHDEVEQFLGVPAFDIPPKVIWLYGLPASGKTTLANKLKSQMQEKGIPVINLDGDEIRSGLNNDLGFSHQDRYENIRRIAQAAKLFTARGYNVIVSAITPRKIFRDLAKEILGTALIDVFVQCPITVCEKRDPKGLYKKVREGKIQHFTGISDPFELSFSTLEVRTEHSTPEQCVQLIFAEFNKQRHKPQDTATEKK